MLKTFQKVDSDYLQSVCEMETMKASPDPARQSVASARAIAAKARVCVHGSASVANALSKFEGAPGQSLTEKKKKCFLEFMVTVRTDTGAKGAQLPQAAIEKIFLRQEKHLTRQMQPTAESGG